MKKNRFSSFLFWILLMGVIIISASFMLRDTSSERLKYSQVVDLFKGEQVKSFVLDESNQLKMELQDGSTVSYKLRSFEQFYLDLSDTVKEQKVREREEDARIKAMREAGFYVFPARPFPDESSDDRDDPGNDTGTDASDSRDKTDLNDTTDTNDAAGSDASSDNTDNADSDSSKPDAHDSSNGSDSSDASDSENSSNDSDDSDNDRA